MEAWTAEAREVEGRAGAARAAAEERRRQAAAAASRIVVVAICVAPSASSVSFLRSFVSRWVLRRVRKSSGFLLSCRTFGGRSDSAPSRITPNLSTSFISPPSPSGGTPEGEGEMVAALLNWAPVGVAMAEAEGLPW